MAYLADRFSRRRIIILGLVGVSLAGLSVGLTQDFWQMVPCFIAMGLLGGTYHAPASSFISQTLPSNVRGRALGLHATGGSASFFLTPILALGIATLFESWRASFLILALPALLVAFTLRISFKKIGRHEDRTHDSEETDGGIPGARRENEARHDEQVSWGRIIRSIGILVFLAVILQVVLASVNSYLPLYMVDHHGISPKWAGVVISIIAGSGIIGAPLGGALSDRIGRKRIILATISLSGPLLFAITRSPFGLPLLISLVIYGLAMSVRLPTMESFIADCVPVVRRTTVLGFYFFLSMETTGITTPLVGRFIDIYGLDPVFTTLATGMCGVAAFALIFRKRI